MDQRQQDNGKFILGLEQHDTGKFILGLEQHDTGKFILGQGQLVLRNEWFVDWKKTTVDIWLCICI